MTIEILPSVTDRNFSYDEAVLYCFFLSENGKTGWRLPTEQEYNSYTKIWGWYLNDARQSSHKTLVVTPVRDIND